MKKEATTRGRITSETKNKLAPNETVMKEVSTGGELEFSGESETIHFSEDSPLITNTTLEQVGKLTGGDYCLISCQGGDKFEETEVNTPPRKLEMEEWEREKEERRNRKKVVLIKGLTLLSRDKKEALESWIRRTLDIKIRVEKLERADLGWRVKLDEWHQKRKLMDGKVSLDEQGWGVQIEDDLTDRQIEVQKWLEKEAEAWRRKDKFVKMEYQRIWIDEIGLKWDELEGELKLIRKNSIEGSNGFRDTDRNKTKSG